MIMINVTILVLVYKRFGHAIKESVVVVVVVVVLNTRISTPLCLCYSLDVRLFTTRTCLRNSEIQCSSGRTSAIKCEKQKRTLALHTALRTVYQRRQLCLTVPVC